MNANFGARGVLDRRCFLEALMALGGAVACSSSGGQNAGAAGGTSSDAVPFGIWKSVRDAVRQSPDHLAQVAQGLVQKGDPTSLFEFVRDQIVACPPIQGSVVTGIRWGAQASLRSGMGTPREKAELLASLYRQAGFSANVVSGYLDDSLDPVLTTAIYTQKITRTFAPPVDDATVAQWLAQMGLSGASAPAIDDDDSERQGLVASIMALLPTNTSASLDGGQPIAGDGIGDIPLVAVQVNGQTTYANPTLPSAEFGTPYASLLNAAPPADASLAVTVEVFVSSTTAATVRTSVAKASFSAEEVVGNQVAVQFVAAVSGLDQLASLRVEDLHVFNPAICLRGPNIDDAALSSKLVVGSPITLRGDVVSTLADGTVTLNGLPVVGTGASTDAGNVSRVATLAVSSVNAAAYPNIAVTLTALDASGMPVLGLPAGAFRVAEQSLPMAFIETGSPMQAATVAMVIDYDLPFSNGDSPLDLGRQAATQIIAGGGNVIAIYAGKASGPFTNVDDVMTALGDADDDDCWADLAAAAGTGAVLTLYVSDYGFSADAAPYQNIAYAGPPVLAIGVPSGGLAVVTDSPEIAGVVAATGGQSLSDAGIAATLSALSDFLSARAATGAYTLSYTAPATGPAQRTVNVQTSDSKLSASGMYTVPANTNAAIPIALSGVYLAVTIASPTASHTVTRVLAGYPGSVAPSTAASPLTQAHIDAVHGAMFGGTLLSFEGGAPTFSAWLDDFLTAKLALEPLWNAVAASDVDAMKTTGGLTRFYIPPELALLQCPVTQDVGTYPSGLRVVACTDQLQIGTGRVRKMDVLSFPGWLTFAADAQTSFALTLARSARAAIVENHLFDASPGSVVSAASVLAGQELQFLAIYAGDTTTIPAAAQQAAVDLQAQYTDFYLLIPAQGPVTAFWAVNSYTGTLLGVLADGSGGASSSSGCMDFGLQSSALSVLGVIDGLAVYSNIGIYLTVGKASAAVFAATAIILDGASDPNFTYDPDQLMQDIAHNALYDAASGGLLTGLGNAGRLGAGLANANSLSSLAGGPSSDSLYPGKGPLAALGC